jgi:hypothetical protein
MEPFQIVLVKFKWIALGSMLGQINLKIASSLSIFPFVSSSAFRLISSLQLFPDIEPVISLVSNLQLVRFHPNLCYTSRFTSLTYCIPLSFSGFYCLLSNKENESQRVLGIFSLIEFNRITCTHASFRLLFSTGPSIKGRHLGKYL